MNPSPAAVPPLPPAIMRPDELAFVEATLTLPWRLGAQGPEALDCWSLTRLVQQRLFGRELPRVVMPENSSYAEIARALAEHPGRILWREVDAPVHGGLVEMTSVRTPMHVGTWYGVDGGLVHHCCEGPGVCLDSLVKLKALTWRGFRFYDWALESGHAG